MTNEMWTHEASSPNFREGFREGLEFARDTVQELIEQLKKDGKLKEASWIEVAREWIDDEHSMYVVGDEE